MLDAVRAGSALVNLLPSHTSRGWPLIEDLFMSDKAIELRNPILAECVSHGEFTAISIDSTFRLCLSIMGQLPFNMSKESRQNVASSMTKAFGGLSLFVAKQAQLSQCLLRQERAERVLLT